MRTVVPWWAVASSALAPILLIGGATLAATLQPPGYSSARDTISELAGLGATDRWVMTTCLLGLGICHLVTASGLRPAAAGGRILLAAGGVATLFVAALPLSREGTSDAHRVAAGIALGALALWPVLAWRRDRAPWALRPSVSIGASALLLALLGWFAAQVAADGAQIGSSERVAAGAQALWPLVVVLTARRAVRT